MCGRRDVKCSDRSEVALNASQIYFEVDLNR